MKKIKALPKRVLIIMAAGLVLIMAAVVVDLNQSNKNSTNEVVAPAARVSITANGFEPANLIVGKGTKILWQNNDDTVHQVQANPYPTGESLPALKSNVLDVGQSYEFTVDQAGEFSYHDAQNPERNGSFTVR